MFSVNELADSLLTGFIDGKHESSQYFRPKIITNDLRQNEKVLETLLAELKTCARFQFGVAFLTRGGVACLHQTLRELEHQSINGQILISQYLNFTDPNALRVLSKFSNVELKLISDHNFHGKSYLFHHDGFSNLIIGSSNLTQDALGKNAELNIKVSLTKKSDLYARFSSHFDQLFAGADSVTAHSLQEYEKIYNATNIQSKLPADSPTRSVHASIAQPKLIPNSMQVEALSELHNVRAGGHSRCLVISATGTGKTVLAALDAERAGAKRLLFIVHRRTIAQKTISEFKKVFGDTKTYGLYSGNHRELSADFVFATVQTINNDRHIHQFNPTVFDYIIIDETHRAGARIYQRVIDYFRPRFLVGMTATPERTDGFDIFKLFNHKVAYEIRLHKAMEADLLAPFHYYGVTDISIDGNELADKAGFKMLTSMERVENMLDKISEYGCDTENPRGLVFCSRVDEAQALAEHFSRRGLPSKALSGADDESVREQTIQRLESDDVNDKLNYIFTVDIFNEGVDIPRINQVLMLRPTASAIIFVQQLGRGLRKSTGKEYLTVIDFIGNYDNNYLIPIALYGDSSYNKDRLRKLLNAGSSLIPGASTINFERIAQEKIFKSIDSANLQTKKALLEDYRLLRYRLGRAPMMMDFVEADSRDPFQYIRYADSLYVFARDEKDVSGLDAEDEKLLKYLCRHINDGCRLEEVLLLKLLLSSKNGEITWLEFSNELKHLIESALSPDAQSSVIANLNLQFVSERVGNKTVSVSKIYNYEVVKADRTSVKLGNSLIRSLKKDIFVDYLKDSVNYSIHAFFRDFRSSDYIGGFKRGCKYSRKNVFRILNWNRNPNAHSVGGYIVSPDKTNCPIFAEYHKAHDTSNTIKYEGRFLSPTRFTYMSKIRRTLNSPDVDAIRKQPSSGMRMPFFVKKNKDEGLSFYYLGELTSIPSSFEQASMSIENERTVDVVKMDFDIDKSVDPSLYNYLTSKAPKLEDK